MLTRCKKPTLFAMVRKIWEFWYKIIRNLVYIRPMAKNLASNRGFSGSRYLLSSTEFINIPSVVTMVTKMWGFNTKLYITRLMLQLWAIIWHQTAGEYRVALFISLIGIKTTLVAMITKILEF